MLQKVSAVKVSTTGCYWYVLFFPIPKIKNLHRDSLARKVIGVNVTLTREFTLLKGSRTICDKHP